MNIVLLSIFMWLVAAFTMTKMLGADPRGWMQVTTSMLQIFVWAGAFFIVTYLVPMGW